MIEEKALNVRKEDGKIFINNREVECLGIFYYLEKETLRLLMNSNKCYVSDVDRFVLDMIIAIQEYITKDNRDSFEIHNSKIEELFNEFRRNLQGILIERFATTGSHTDLETVSE
jgi:hypothetical protein